MSVIRNKREDALVLGGSLSGLLAARALSNHFERVTLVERDVFPLTPESRRGTPQANHVHALMPRGRQIVEQLFPNLHEEMMADGAPLIDMGADISWLTPQGWGVRFESDLEVLAFTRPLLDFHVRRRLSTIPNLRILQDTEIVRLVEGKKNDVGGALVRASTPDGVSVETILKADLIVDATGRASRAPEWLEDLGYPKPTETVVNAYLGYSSRLFEPPAELNRDWQCAFIQSAPPEEKRGGLLFAVEGNRWLVTLIGGGRDYPPRDDEGFLEFTRSLRSPILYDAIKNATPISPIKTHRGTENRLRHFSALSRQPSNFVALGDALCAFNPVYGQGMTIAAMGVLELDSCLRNKKIAGESFSKIFHRRMVNVVKAPWLLATGQDYRYRETVGGTMTRTTRFMHSYMDRILTLSTVDKTVRTALLKVFGMLSPPSALFRPGILRRVAWQSLRGPGEVKQQHQTRRRRLTYETSLERRL